MAYKEEHFDKAGANALAKALAEMNDNVMRGGSKKGASSKKGTAKKTTSKKK